MVGLESLLIKMCDGVFAGNIGERVLAGDVGI